MDLELVCLIWIKSVLLLVLLLLLLCLFVGDGSSFLSFNSGDLIELDQKRLLFLDFFEWMIDSIFCRTVEIYLSLFVVPLIHYYGKRPPFCKMATMTTNMVDTLYWHTRENFFLKSTRKKTCVKSQ